MRLKEFRTRRGLSQTELGKLVGVTPSTISQVESNLIYPSLPALLKMAEVLAIELSSFFKESVDITNRMIFPSGEAVDMKLPNFPEESIHAKLLTPVDFKPKAEPFLLEIPPNKAISVKTKEVRHISVKILLVFVTKYVSTTNNQKMTPTIAEIYPIVV